MTEFSTTTSPPRFYLTRTLVILVAVTGIAFSLFGFWYSAYALCSVKFATAPPPFQQHEYPHFYPAFYGMAFVSFSLGVLLLFTSLQLLRFRMGWSLLFVLLMAFELIYFKSVIAAWFHPTFGKSIMAASGLANGPLVPFLLTKYPYWASLIILWGWYRLPSSTPDPKSRRRVLLSFISLLILLVAIPLVAMAAYRPDLEIEYHKARMRWAYDSQHINPETQDSMPGVTAYSIDQAQVAIYEKHRQRLIELGIVREFNHTCRHLFHATPEGRHFQRLRPKAPWCIDGSSPYSTEKVPIHWTFWCFSEDEPRLTEFFQQYDIPDYREKFMDELPPKPENQ